MNIQEFLDPVLWLSTKAEPRYIQLRKCISNAVGQDILTPGSPLPPEREIAGLTDLSRVTVRKGIQALVAAGLILQKQGSGPFISGKFPRIEQSLSRFTSFTE